METPHAKQLVAPPALSRPDLRGWKREQLSWYTHQIRVPTRLEGMETTSSAIFSIPDPKSRPDLRGWKPLSMLFLHPLYQVPTRLEGMETFQTGIGNTSSWREFRPDLRGWKVGIGDWGSGTGDGSVRA